MTAQPRVSLDNIGADSASNTMSRQRDLLVQAVALLRVIARQLIEINYNSNSSGSTSPPDELDALIADDGFDADS